MQIVQTSLLENRGFPFCVPFRNLLFFLIVLTLLPYNLSLIRVDEIKRMMEEYGDVRDVYIPQDYHTRRPR